MVNKFFTYLLIVGFSFVFLSCSRSDQTDKNFLTLKEKGILAINEDRLTEGIEILKKALQIKPDLEVTKKLDDAYIERGDYFYSLGKIDEAVIDYKKCSKSDVLLKSSLYKIECSKAPEIIKPLNQEVLETNIVDFNWSNIQLVDYYEIQIENQNWDTLLIAKAQTAAFKTAKELNFEQVYYWRVRPHFITNEFGLWTNKNWFAIRRNDPSKILEFSVIKDQKLPDKKSVIDLRIKNESNLQELTKFTQSYYKAYCKTQTFIKIFFYLPEMVVDSGAYARSETDGITVKVEFYGFTSDQINQTEESLNKDIIGAWKWNQAGGILYYLRKENDRYTLEIVISGSSTGRKAVSILKPNGVTVIKEKKPSNYYGEYFIVTSSGDLEICDEEGYIDTATAILPLKEPLKEKL